MSAGRRGATVNYDQSTASKPYAQMQLEQTRLRWVDWGGRGSF